MTERVIEGPVQRQSYRDDLVMRGELFVGPDGKVTQYIEEFADGVYSLGWQTEMGFDIALEALLSSKLVMDDIGHDIEVYSDGSWGVSTEEGSFYCSVDPSGSRVAGAMSYEDGLSTDAIDQWRGITSLQDS